jgi:serpin B
MMHGDVVPYVENESFQAVALPYTGKLFSLVVFLPRQVEGLAQLEGWLTPEFVSRWMNRMKTQPVEIYFPKFKLESSLELGGNLAEMGMPSALSPVSADFSGINGASNLYISSVFHKAWIDVGEQGSEAAAATAVAARMSSVRTKPAPRPPTFRADHPFVFFIRGNSSGRILFLGRVQDPTL